MKKQDIIRAWKDEEFRLSLTDEQRAQLPQNPAGVIELADDELRSVAGGCTHAPCFCPDEVSCRG
jgi:mersacidin/lichenicidin family type 2 lantibiotic